MGMKQLYGLAENVIIIDGDGDVRQHRQMAIQENELPDTTLDTMVKVQWERGGAGFITTFGDEIKEMIEEGYHQDILHNPRLVLYKLLDKTKNGITVKKAMAKNVSGAINYFKYKGEIKNHWMLDTRRDIIEYGHYRDKADALRSLINRFYLDRWERQSRRILLMCEASGYLGVMQNIATHFRIPYTAASGDMSPQIKIEIAELCNEPTRILYYGDNDDKGHKIPKTIEAHIRAINPNADLIWHRMFLNKGDEEKYGLLKGAQMEQLPAEIAIEESIEYINGLIDWKTWNETLAEEEMIRESLRQMQGGQV